MSDELEFPFGLFDKTMELASRRSQELTDVDSLFLPLVQKIQIWMHRICKEDIVTLNQRCTIHSCLHEALCLAKMKRHLVAGFAVCDNSVNTHLSNQLVNNIQNTFPENERLQATNVTAVVYLSFCPGHDYRMILSSNDLDHGPEFAKINELQLESERSVSNHACA